MARKLKAFPEDQVSKHPWDDYLNGDIWEIQQGEDFDCKPVVMRNQIYNTAHKRDLDARVSVRGNIIVFQALPIKKSSPKTRKTSR